MVSHNVHGKGGRAFRIAVGIAALGLLLAGRTHIELKAEVAA